MQAARRLMNLLALLDHSVLNFSILGSMVSLLGLTYPYRNDARAVHLVARWLLLAGSGAFLLHHSMIVSTGVRADLRLLPVALATVLGGPLYGLSVSIPMVIYRFSLGGVGFWPSCIGIGMTVLASLLISRRRNQFQLDLWELLRTSALISVAGNLSYLLIPGNMVVFLLTVPIKAGCLLLAFVLLQTRFRLVGSFQDFREMAFTDKLTGLNNRRRFDEDLKPGQADPAVFLLLLDIDHFKAVNDRYGHDFGDKVLAETALLMRENLRPWDGAYRYGGEEFAVLLRHCTPQQARLVAERIRASIEQRMPERLNCLVTISIGGVSLPLRIQPVISLRQADDALYTAKKAGRNRVIWEDPRSSKPRLSGAELV